MGELLSTDASAVMGVSLRAILPTPKRVGEGTIAPLSRSASITIAAAEERKISHESHFTINLP